MIWKGLKKRNILEQRNDEIDWKKTTFLALITSVDAFLAGIGMGFLEAQMIHQSLTIFPITVLSVIGGVYVGYRLGTVHNRGISCRWRIVPDCRSRCSDSILHVLMCNVDNQLKY